MSNSPGARVVAARLRAEPFPALHSAGSSLLDQEGALGKLHAKPGGVLGRNGSLLIPHSNSRVPAQYKWFPSGFASCAPREQLQLLPQPWPPASPAEGCAAGAAGTAGPARTQLGKVHKSSSILRWAPSTPSWPSQLPPSRQKQGKPLPNMRGLE